MYELVFDMDNYFELFIPLLIASTILTGGFVMRREEKNIFGRVFLFIYIFLALIFFIKSFSFAISELYSLNTKKRYFVEGEIENFVPMPYGGHSFESFSVNGIRFSYSDYMTTGCFNETKSHGGEIEGNGQKVKIEYNKNCIMKLWIEREE